MFRNPTPIEQYIIDHSIELDEWYCEKYPERIIGEYYDTVHYINSVYEQANLFCNNL